MHFSLQNMSFHLIFEFDCDYQFFIYLLIYLLFSCLIVVQIEYFSGVFQTWASSQLSDGIMISFDYIFVYGILISNVVSTLQFLFHVKLCLI